MTPLLFAVSSGHLSTTKILINGGADVNIGDKEGKTPLSIAIEKGYSDLAPLLKEYGGKEGKTEHQPVSSGLNCSVV